MKKRIVIADDEPITRMDISEILEEAGYDVVGQASDGFDAIELCKKFRPHLVLMDVKMPLLNGMKAAKVIKEEELADCIALLTAYSSKEFIEEAKEVGVMAYIVKPIDERNLLPAIEVALAKSEEIKKIKGDIKKTKEKLEARKLIEKAKGILVKNHGISEDEAYNKIRKLSMDKRYPMQTIAHAIIMNDGL
ncbi:ANTAR domain-containing response regulator [Anaerophilus nitritogenes]|uniref:ANTAR domain-containing response regulator n=1 Tax=Anaerophilus nitritogenes TaxID=2498136 RepID=UPI00101C6760|nr:response regulator [Anaerophilus nitritogenes]